MRKAALVGFCLVLSGCSGFGKFVGDTATLPGANPNAPSGEDLNMRRVNGYSTAETPLLPAGGDIWPGPPAPLPTLEDVEKDRAGTILGGVPNSGSTQLPDGGEMSVGEPEGLSDKSHSITGKLPDAEPDAASQYGVQRGSASTIEIPNGDGTVTLIHPDGSVTTTQAKKAAAPVAPQH
ncbi:hypothetical protein [Acetobacter orleanensis]|uniref:Lipoprotein n=1 Tax=Acetobacter orleanensis TaxID=104099 RepID=A0A4Y3TJ18_9PROT|nr:hypothetical protein [Acetobacter orleanensis]KXV62047.1 hypothetical protein AD949_12365 [Acetobacter orleanensis]PCD80382.1 hypothetical protein CO710_01070 [Acetobacter orleanensis]GAN68510.1 hypothetical protein Abol_018_003 [Acetobacter orleanensis JCM 7639]GEB81733.1 hypothetical protein AOR01nite_02100 [Acetobacter orleanensis]